MKTVQLNRNSEIIFRNGKKARNRIVIPPMASGTADTLGFVTDATLAHYANLAKAGAGIVMVEYTYVHRSGRSELQQLGIQSQAHVAGLAQLAKVIHQSGALAGIQLTHAGGKTSTDLTEGVMMAPCAVRVPVKDRELEIPTPMSLDEIRAWRTWFLQAAVRAVAAEFDLVEVHAAHGYGFNQWLSPITNHRQDQFGGALKRRARLLFEVIESIRKAHGNTLVTVRMPGGDFINGGLSSEDSVRVAKQLVQLGVDLLDVSSGIGGWRRPNDRDGEGYLVPEAKVIQSHVNVPVIGVGGLRSGEKIDELIASGAISLAAVGRAILENPAAWGRAHLAAPSNF
jgi:NADPH2 dehydrogenase